MKNLTDDLASLRKIVSELIPHTTDLLNENTRLKEIEKAAKQVDACYNHDGTKRGTVNAYGHRVSILSLSAALKGKDPPPMMEYRLDGEVVSREEAERLLSTVTWIGRNADLDVPGSVDSAPADWFILQWDYKAVKIEGQKE